MRALNNLTGKLLKSQMSDYGAPNDLVLLRMVAGATAAFVAKTVVDYLYAKRVQAPTTVEDDSTDS